MHFIVYLAFLSVSWTFSLAIAATLPLADDRTSKPSIPAAPPIVRLGNTASCPPNSVSCLPNNPSASLRTTRCNVPGTHTVLLIETATRSVAPFQVKQLLLHTRRIIARKLAQTGGVDGHLLISEVPFESAAWGLEMKVDPTPGPSPRDVLLTWRLLDETMAGLLVCEYDRGPFLELQAIITRVNERGVLESKGTLFLRRVFPASPIPSFQK